MTAFNVVRFRTKPGQEEAFLNEHRDLAVFPGMRRFSLMKTGERSYCIVGEWESMATLIAARPTMIGKLDRMRGMLEDLGGGLGLTDAASGDVLIEASS